METKLSGSFSFDEIFNRSVWFNHARTHYCDPFPDFSRCIKPRLPFLWVYLLMFSGSLEASQSQSSWWFWWSCRHSSYRFFLASWNPTKMPIIKEYRCAITRIVCYTYQFEIIWNLSDAPLPRWHWKTLALTLIEFIAVLAILGILASLSIPRFINLDSCAGKQFLIISVTELNGRESLIWSKVKRSTTGWVDDEGVFEKMDTGFGPDYKWSPKAKIDGGKLHFKDQMVKLDC